VPGRNNGEPAISHVKPRHSYVPSPIPYCPNYTPEKARKMSLTKSTKTYRCWDGVNLDSADHSSHVSYPVNGTFEAGAPCPATHPVPIPQLFFEIVWDTTPFNDLSEWPEDGSQPFIWSYGDATVRLSATFVLFLSLSLSPYGCLSSLIRSIQKNKRD
jgi:hypothetical protein